MFFGKPYKVFGFTFSALVFMSATVLDWKVVEAQLGKKQEIGNLLAAGIIAAVLGMHHKRRHAEKHARHQQEQQQETVLMPVPMVPMHHHHPHHPMASATMRHPFGALVPNPMMSPTQVPPFFMHHPMMAAAPVPWEHMAALSTMQRLHQQHQQLPPALATFSGLANPMMAAAAAASFPSPMATLAELQRMESEAESMMSVREIHPTSSLAATIEQLIRQLDMEG